MPTVKKAKELTYRGKPIYRKGNVIYYGDLSKDLILVLEIGETEKAGEYDITKNVKFHIRDNKGEVGEGMNYRSGERVFTMRSTSARGGFRTRWTNKKSF